MRVVADSHTALWYAQGSTRLSEAARSALSGAEDEGGIVVSIATLIDLWYVTQTTKGVTSDDLQRLRSGMLSSPAVHLHPVDVAISDAYASIDRSALADPWDRLILATALALELPLVTRDGAIRAAGLVPTIWYRGASDQRYIGVRRCCVSSAFPTQLFAETGPVAASCGERRPELFECRATAMVPASERVFRRSRFIHDPDVSPLAGRQSSQKADAGVLSSWRANVAEKQDCSFQFFA